MGESGSGKTSLLSTLANRRTRAGTPIVGGEISMNNRRVRHVSEVSEHSTYVTQDDELPATLTVREALTYAALLKIPKQNDESRYRAVNAAVKNLLVDLGLDSCAENRIGGEWRKSQRISGGERRRVSIALQLMGRPSILFLDEPTSGLDSSSARNLVSFLHRLSRRKGTTIVLSIHQPSAFIFGLFDRLLLLSKGGNVAYEGPANETLEFFGKLGFQCPASANPADFFLDVISGLQMREFKQSVLQENEGHRMKNVSGWRDEKTSHSLGGDGSTRYAEGLSQIDGNETRKNTSSKIHQKVSFIRQVWTLTKRESLMTLRNRATAIGFITQSLIIAVCLGVIFYKPGNSPAAVEITKKSVLYLSSSNQPYITVVFAVYTACQDFKVFDQERADKLYAPSAYVIAHYFAHLPIHIISPTIYYSIVYFMTGLRVDSISHPFFYVAVGILAQNTAVALAWFCAAVSRSFDTASLIANFLFTFTVLAGGFVVSWNTIPAWIGWWKYVSFQGYAFRLFAINELHGNSYKSGDVVLQGDDVLKTYGFSPDWQTPLIYLCTILVALQTVAFGILIFFQYHPNLEDFTTPEKKHQNETNGYSVLSNGPSERQDPRNEFNANQSPSEIEIESKGVHLEVRNVNLVAKSTEWKKDGKHKIDRQILSSVSAQFPARKLSVIIGPSGSGKTSLLNVIAGRCSPRHFELDGEVLMNGNLMKGSSIGMVCYMNQNPTLLPALTVRETLQFAAHLSGNPTPDSVDTVISDLGLNECGGRLVSLCSGGQKRRTAIASYLITRPSILLLDEPTTGLDSASSVKLVSALNFLARKHATIVATIHQPRQDVYDLFSQLVIMGKGNLVYSGDAKFAREYFENTFSLRFPNGMSIPEFLLDIVHGRNDTEGEFTGSKVMDSNDRKHINARIDGTRRESFPSLEVLKRQWNAWADGKAGSGRLDVGIVGEIPPPATKLAFLKIFWHLLSRSMINFSRQPKLIVARFMQIVTFGVILSIYFWQNPRNQVGIVNYMNVLWEVNSLVFVGMLNCTASFPAQRDLFYRERADGRYSTKEFFLAYCALEIPFAFFCSLVFSLVLTFTVRLKQTVVAIVLLSLTVFFIISLGESIGMLYCATFKQVGFALSLISVNLGLFQITTGFLSVHLNSFIDAVLNVNPLRFASTVLANVELPGLSFSCEKPTFTTCLQAGKDVREYYGFSARFTQNIMLMVVISVLYRYASFLALKYFPKFHGELHAEWSLGNTPNNPEKKAISVLSR